MIESNTMVGTGTGIKLLCSQEELSQKLGVVSRAVSTRASVQILSGILVRFERGTLVMAATDSYRLSVKETTLTGDAPEFEAIIPARALGELARIAQSGETIELGIHEN